MVRLSLIIVFLWSGIWGVDARTWNLPAGEKIEGTMVACDKEKITLRLAKGETKELQISDLSSSDKSYVKGFQSGKNKRYLEMLETSLSVIDQITVPELQKFEPKNGSVPIKEYSLSGNPETHKGILETREIRMLTRGVFENDYSYITCFNPGGKYKSNYWVVVHRLTSTHGIKSGLAVVPWVEKQNFAFGWFYCHHFKFKKTQMPRGIAYVTETRSRLNSSGKLLTKEEEAVALEKETDKLGLQSPEIAYLLFMDEKGQLKYGIVQYAPKNKTEMICCFDEARNLVPIDWYSTSPVKIGSQSYTEDLEKAK